MNNYCEALDNVLFNKAWTPLFLTLSDDDAGKLIKALFKFMNGEDVKLESEPLQAVYSLLTSQLEGSAYRYLQKVNYYEKED